MGLPLVVQIRLSAKKGLFKGCLIVTSDLSLCPAGKVVVRSSMRKAAGAHHIQAHDGCILAVVKTFEHPSRLYYDSNSYNCDLNLLLCLHLVHLGVPQRRFEELMQEELDRVVNSIYEKKLAKTLIQRSLERNYSVKKFMHTVGGEEDSDEDEDENEEAQFYSLSALNYSNYII
jgi:RNA dependent RNA polymerase